MDVAGSTKDQRDVVKVAQPGPPGHFLQSLETDGKAIAAEYSIGFDTRFPCQKEIREVRAVQAPSHDIQREISVGCPKSPSTCDVH